MKKTDFAKGNRTASMRKRIVFAAILMLACFTMSACIMEPDRIVDDPANVNFPQAGQNFSTVVTDTPVPTNTPKPTDPPMTSTTGGTEVDFSGWQFGNNTPTNPPSNNQPGITNNTGAPVTITIGTVTDTPKPESTPKTSTTGGSSTSSSTLKVGSSGTEVKALQNRLKELGYYKGSVDGKFGNGTADAVKAFQRAHNLSADGKAGPKTLQMLNSSNAIKASSTNSGQSSGSGNKPKPSGSSSTSSNNTSNTSSTYTNGRNDIYLKLGSSNHSQVKILQNRLIVLGYLTGTADGNYDEITEAAVKAFQKRNSIYDDGVAGPETLTKLYSSSAKKASSVVGNLGSLSKGSQGGAVRNLQKQLKELGYYNGSIDGDYGDGTVAAVTAFQQQNGLTVDGVAGKGTQNAIYGALGGGSSGNGGGGSSSSSQNPQKYGQRASSNGYTTVSSNSGSVSNVTAVQSALSAKGYYSGTFDGDYGAVTEQAVRDYQASMGLRVTGMAGPCTQRLLFGGTKANGSYSKLQPGSSGSKVKTLQYALYELKFYDGDITGSYDTATENAVLSFQAQHGLYADGIAGQETQATLYSSNARPFND